MEQNNSEENKKILLVEDDKNIRDAIARFLNMAGYKVVTAEDGNIGLEMINSEHFDLIITDVVMPGIEGVEFIYRAKQINDSIPIVVMSGHTFGKESFEVARELGAVAAFEKPFNLKHFGEEIKKIIGDWTVSGLDEKFYIL